MPYKDKENKKKYRRQYYLKNRDRELEMAREWRLKNKGYHREYYLCNRERMIKDSKEYIKVRVDKGLCASCSRPMDVMGMVVSKRYCPLCRESFSEANRWRRYLNST